jgi:hypothetical protein
MGAGGLFCGQADYMQNPETGKLYSHHDNCLEGYTCACNGSRLVTVNYPGNTVGTSETKSCYQNEQCVPEGNNEKAKCVATEDIKTKLRGAATDTVPYVVAGYCSPAAGSTELLGISKTGNIVGVEDCKNAYGPTATCEVNTCRVNGQIIPFDPTLFQ